MEHKSLGDLVLAIAANQNVSPEEVSTFSPVIATLKDVEAVAKLIEVELGFNPLPFAILRLVEMWNSLPGNKQITGIDAYIDGLRMIYLDEIQAMQRIVSNSRRLKEVFTREWFDSVLNEVIGWSGRDSFTTSKHGAFISHLQYAGADNPLLQQIDDAFCKLDESIGRKLGNKLRDIPRDLDDGYVSTVFEILVTARFHGKILEYEPRLSSGRPEARVSLEGNPVLIEAKATRDMELGEYRKEKDAVLAAKARDKYAGQLRGATEPVVLFFGLNIGVHDLIVYAMLRRIVQDPDSPVLSAIMFSDTFHAQHFKLWVNPNANLPLSSSQIDELKDLFDASDFVLR